MSILSQLVWSSLGYSTRTIGTVGGVTITAYGDSLTFVNENKISVDITVLNGINGSCSFALPTKKPGVLQAGESATLRAMGRGLMVLVQVICKTDKRWPNGKPVGSEPWMKRFQMP